MRSQPPPVDSVLGVTSREEWGEITRLLQDHRKGDREAFDSLVPMIYEQLRVIARRQLRRLPRGETFGTIGLVHEAYMHLVDEKSIDWRDRSHFLAVSARAMRRIAVDHARRRGAQKRGGGLAGVTLEPHHALGDDRAETVLLVHEVLKKLAAVNERLVQVVECRYFTGYTEEETAAALGVTSRTVQRDWLRARAWLLAALEEPGRDDTMT